MTDSVNAGADDGKEHTVEATWSSGEQCWKVAARSRCCNVATSLRRDVPTSRRPYVMTFQRRDVRSTNTEVNNQKRRDVSTSQRCNVAMSARDLHLII